MYSVHSHTHPVAHTNCVTHGQTHVGSVTHTHNSINKRSSCCPRHCSSSQEGLSLARLLSLMLNCCREASSCC
ncbi:hypothetical protein XELAEV_18001274mg [Xenopus laevis]|uniref:Uncharacterized protein n=1 Tax=Xenopus laevis TaxID=8355 RepID=A0A974GYG6_XENLA|nr:hypothetical protein XELAEV_18001274mg [Xenopus laevis]